MYIGNISRTMFCPYPPLSYAGWVHCVRCCSWGSGLTQDTGKAWFLNKSFQGRGVQNDWAQLAPELCGLKIWSCKTTYFLALFIKTQAKTWRCLKKAGNILREATERGLQQGKHHKVGWNAQSWEGADGKQVRDFHRGREMEGKGRSWRHWEEIDCEGNK